MKNLLEMEGKYLFFFEKEVLNNIWVEVTDYICDLQDSKNIQCCFSPLFLKLPIFQDCYLYRHTNIPMHKSFGEVSSC